MSPARWAISPTVGTLVRSTTQPVACLLRAMLSDCSCSVTCRLYRSALTTRGCFELGRPGPYVGRSLTFYVHPVIGTLQGPQLGGDGFGIRLAAILLAGCRVHGGRQRRR